MDMKWIKNLASIFRDWRKTHNQGVFDAYTPEMKAARKSGVITGLPDAYGRGRIIGDYRRVALYGIDHLIEEKKADYNLTGGVMSEDTMRLREELSEQMRALQELKQWLLLMDSIFLSQLQMHKKLSNGYTLDILQQLKSKMVQQCALDVLLHS